MFRRSKLALLTGLIRIPLGCGTAKFVYTCYGRGILGNVVAALRRTAGCETHACIQQSRNVNMLDALRCLEACERGPGFGIFAGYWNLSRELD